MVVFKSLAYMKDQLLEKKKKKHECSQHNTDSLLFLPNKHMLSDCMTLMAQVQTSGKTSKKLGHMVKDAESITSIQNLFAIVPEADSGNPLYVDTAALCPAKNGATTTECCPNTLDILI